jgi:hypothetical protein
MEDAVQSPITSIPPGTPLPTNNDGTPHKTSTHSDSCFGADREVVLHFASLHDACRQNEYEDPKHGQRAANWVNRLDLSLDQDQKKTLIQAVRHHNDGQITDDSTVEVCWDSDRLDLPRVGITPDASFWAALIGRNGCRCSSAFGPSPVFPRSMTCPDKQISLADRDSSR